MPKEWTMSVTDYTFQRYHRDQAEVPLFSFPYFALVIPILWLR